MRDSNLSVRSIIVKHLRRMIEDIHDAGMPMTCHARIGPNDPDAVFESLRKLWFEVGSHTFSDFAQVTEKTFAK